jgi:2-keto-4-pentenoate hydratase
VLAHLANAGDMIGRFSELAPTTRLEIFGAVSDELRQLVAPFGAEIVGHWTGFTR